jgi:hypothetical protein
LPHRDPETGQFLAHGDDEAIDLNYADHEFLNFRIATLTEGSDGGDFGTEYQIESDVLDLENDELAMLTWVNASLSVSFNEFPQVATTRGGAYVNVEIGANLSGNEYLSQASVNSGINETDAETPVNSYALQASDEPGLWAALNAGAQSAFKESDADGNFSGGADAGHDRMRRVYSEETSGGPYIDATDDVNIGIYVNKFGTETPIQTVVYGEMAFVVMEYENRRAEFAPYDPGASMD